MGCQGVAYWSHEAESTISEQSQVPATRRAVCDPVRHRTVVLQYSCLLLLWNDSSDLRTTVIPFSPEKTSSGRFTTCPGLGCEGASSYTLDACTAPFPKHHRKTSAR